MCSLSLLYLAVPNTKRNSYLHSPLNPPLTKGDLSLRSEVLKYMLCIYFCANSIFGFGGTIVDGARKREIARQACLNRANLSFYCNSHRLSRIRNSAGAKRSFAESFWCRFFQKGAVLGGEHYSRFCRPRSAARRSSIWWAAS